MLKKRGREGSDLSKQKLKKLKLGNNEEQSDIIESEVGSTFYEFVGKNDVQNFIWKLIVPEKDMNAEDKKLEAFGKLKSGKLMNLNFNTKNLGKGQGGVLKLNFSILTTNDKNSNFQNLRIQDSHLNNVFKDISFDIEVSLNIVNYKVFNFSFNSVKLNETQTLESNISNEFYLKFFNKLEDTIIVFEFKIKKNFKSIVNGEMEGNIGYIGIINEAMTCYMNSMLQTLNILGSFKKAVFQIPTNELEDYNSVAISLQRLFYDLMKNTYPVSTNKLVKSFGWSKEDILIQHDVQEFNLHLSDVMKKKMKGTPGEGTFSNLFEGRLMNYIDCINVSYKSEKAENFCDLQLTVKVIYLTF
jgi:hypothetical protein